MALLVIGVLDMNSIILDAKFEQGATLLSAQPAAWPRPLGRRRGRLPRQHSKPGRAGLVEGFGTALGHTVAANTCIRRSTATARGSWRRRPSDELRRGRGGSNMRTWHVVAAVSHQRQVVDELQQPHASHRVGTELPAWAPGTALAPAPVVGRPSHCLCYRPGAAARRALA